MKTQSYGVRLDPELKNAGAEILESIGLNFTDGVRLFLKQMVNRGELPIELKVPNAKTQQAIEELESMSNESAHDSLEAFSKALTNEDSRK